MPVYGIASLNDKEEIRAFLEEDKGYAAYALGDLEPPYAAKSEWYGAQLGSRLEAIALVYKGLEPAALFLMGSSEAVSALLMHGVGPDTVHFNIRPHQQKLLETWYTLQKPDKMVRMRVTKDRFRPYQESKFPIVRLGESRTDALNSLFKLGEAKGESVVAFTPEMVKSGYFHGIYLEEKLIAAAGTHLVAKKARLAALGNVFTHPDFRNKGLGTATSNAVTATLLEAGIETVVLNVADSNKSAAKIYEKLGFTQVGPFVEGQAKRL